MELSGSELLEAALGLRDRRNADVAAQWMQSKGIPWELAMLALVGAVRASKFGVQTNTKPRRPS